MIPDLKILRWKAINVIFKRWLIESSSKFRTEQDLLLCVGRIFDIYLIAHAKNKSIFTEWDNDLFDDIVLISVNMLKESTFFDFSTFNPVSFLSLIILEHGLKNNPYNMNFKIYLIKFYRKLGCKTRIREIAHSIDDFEGWQKISKYLFSFYSEFGLDKDLESHLNEYKIIND